MSEAKDILLLIMAALASFWAVAILAVALWVVAAYVVQIQ